MARTCKTNSTIMTAQAWDRAARQLDQIETMLRQVKLPQHMRAKLDAAKLAVEALSEQVEVEVMQEHGIDHGQSTPLDLDPSKF